MEERDEHNDLNTDASADDRTGETADEQQEEQEDPLADATEEQLREEVERLRAEVDELRDKHLRAVAELQNFKRRSTREQAQRLQYANQELLSQIIPIMDNLQRALEHQEHAGSDDFARGVELVVQQFHEMLRSFGVEPVKAEGELFDPQVHEAVAQVETDQVPEGTILEVDTPGYCLHDRCLRPAKVVVARAPQQQ
ncbi:MAG: nucleotide exchange factor GrpE [Armatimonadetes bacterium]|nr:nucleotide exchange factor GrpE [Armatimonadota bacterium]